MIYVLTVIHTIVCIFLILVVLLQQGKGADLSVFGGGSTQTAFGARGAATLLHKLTVASFVIFILTTVSIALVKTAPGTVMSDVPAEAIEDMTEPQPATEAGGSAPPQEAGQEPPSATTPSAPAPADSSAPQGGDGQEPPR